MSAQTFRQYAKTSYQVELSEAEAERMRNAFFRTYSGVAAWHQRQKTVVNFERFVRTVSGRKRKWADNSSLPITQAFNTPDQGTGADVLKTAMAYIHRELYSRGWEDAAVINSVHDEIVLEGPANSIQDAAELVRRNMEAAWYDLMGDSVPIDVGLSTGTSWADKE